MNAEYAECPECGEEATHRPLFPARSPRVDFIQHDHGCSVSRWFVCLHPDGDTETVGIVPEGMMAEEWARQHLQGTAA